MIKSLIDLNTNSIEEKSGKKSKKKKENENDYEVMGIEDQGMSLVK